MSDCWLGIVAAVLVTHVISWVISGIVYSRHGAVVKDLRAEVERLTEALRLAGDVQITYRGAWDKWQQRAERAEARLAKVVEALRAGVKTDVVMVGHEGRTYFTLTPELEAALAAVRPEGTWVSTGTCGICGERNCQGHPLSTAQPEKEGR